MLLFAKMLWYSQLRRTIFSWWAPGALRLWLCASTMARIRLSFFKKKTRNHRWLPVASMILRPFVDGTLAKKLFFFWKLLQDSQQSFSTQRSYITHRICLGCGFHKAGKKKSTARSPDDTYSLQKGFATGYFKPAYKMRWLYVCISTQSDNGDIRIPAFVTFLRTALLLHPSNGNARAVAKSAVQVAMTVSFRVCEIPRTAWPPKTLPGWSRLTGWSLPPEKSTANNDQGWHQPNPTKPRAPALRSTLHLPKASTLTHLGWCLETPAWW